MQLKQWVFSKSTKFVFFWKNRCVFSKKYLKVFKIVQSGQFAVECLSNDVIFKNFLSILIVKFFRWKIRKLSKLEKLKKTWWRKKIFWKKRFHPFRRHLQQNWRVENMPVVPGRLVLSFFELHLASLQTWFKFYSMFVREHILTCCYANNFFSFLCQYQFPHTLWFLTEVVRQQNSQSSCIFTIWSKMSGKVTGITSFTCVFSLSRQSILLADTFCLSGFKKDFA